METITEMHCRGAWWQAEMAFYAPSATELDCRFAWWQAACDFFAWSQDEASAAIDGFIWSKA